MTELSPKRSEQVPKQCSEQCSRLTLVVVRTRDPHRQSEALRAALGLTLRGARVEVVVDDLLTPLAVRSAETLKSFGHAVGVDLHDAMQRADAVEVWT